MAIALAALLPCAFLGFLVSVVDRPSLSVFPVHGKATRAAIAIRDSEKPLMQWGTRVFTWPTLSRHYGRVDYFTQSSKADEKEAFIAALTQALQDYPSVDLFLLAHTNSYIEWVREVDEPLRQRLRLVYNTGCYNAKQGDEWLGVGAQTYIGHVGTSFSPFFYFPFLRRWIQGEKAEDALDASNALMRRAFRRMDAASHGKYDEESMWRNSEARLFGQADARIGGLP